jgi:hypothetical protein
MKDREGGKQLTWIWVLRKQVVRKEVGTGGGGGGGVGIGVEMFVI